MAARVAAAASITLEGAPKVKNLDAGAVEKLFAEGVGSLQGCLYSRARDDSQERANIQVTVGVDGFVSVALARGGFLDVDCVRETVARWSWPRPTKPEGGGARAVVNAKSTAAERAELAKREQAELARVCARFKALPTKTPEALQDVLAAVHQESKTWAASFWTGAFSNINAKETPTLAAKDLKELGVPCLELEKWVASRAK